MVVLTVRPKTTCIASATTGGALAGTYYYAIAPVVTKEAVFREGFLSNVTVVVVNGANNAALVSWGRVEGATGYIIYKGYDAVNLFEHAQTDGISYTDVVHAINSASPYVLGEFNNIRLFPITDETNIGMPDNIGSHEPATQNLGGTPSKLIIDLWVTTADDYIGFKVHANLENTVIITAHGTNWVNGSYWFERTTFTLKAARKGSGAAIVNIRVEAVKS